MVAYHMYDSAFGMLAIDRNHLNEYLGFVIFPFQPLVHYLRKLAKLVNKTKRTFLGIALSEALAFKIFVGTVNT